MHIGTLQIKLHLPNSQSLKAKRRIIKSLMDKLKHRYNVAVAEVDYLDQWQLASIGIVSVCNEGKPLEQLLAKILQYVKENSHELVLLDHQKEVSIL
jgi:uncharacterized protein